MSNFHLPPSYSLHQRYKIIRAIGQGGFGKSYDF
jgi:hypothetical protein